MNLKGLAFITIILTYILIVFGGYVASSESGMGCGPEWPLCNGDVVPVLEGETLIEFAHRAIGATLGIITVILFFKISRAKPDQTLRSAAWGLLIFLAIQILLGAVVVVLDLPVFVVSIHLIVAMLFLATLIWVWRKVSEEPISAAFEAYKPEKRIFIFHFNIILALLLLTIALGGYIKHQSYGLECGWLDCDNGYLPASIPAMLQTGHRLLAAVLAIYILILTFIAFTRKWDAGLQNRLMALSLLVIGQILIGVLTIISYIDIPWAVLHLALGTAIFAFGFEGRVYASSAKGKKSTMRAVHSKREQYLD